MLVLSRKKQDQIVVDESVVITVLGIERGRVRLGIEAPRRVSIVRAELCQSIAGQPRESTANPRIGNSRARDNSPLESMLHKT